MTPPEVTRQLDVLPDARQAIGREAIRLRRSMTAAAQRVVHLEGAVDRVLRHVRQLRPSVGERA